MAKPNIIYLHSHDTGRYVQPYGYGISTPNMQRLAEQGVLFRQAFCAGPTCSPSRAALLFGQYPHQCGMLGLANLGWSIRDMREHVIHTLKGAGYDTALCGTQHMVNPPVSQIGYDEVVAHEARGLVECASAWLRARAAGAHRPFFLDLGHGLTHRHRYLDATPAENPAYLSPPAPMPDHPAVRADFARFVASCKQLDRDWGRVLEVLDETDLAANTLVICTTDHGIGWPNMKCTLHDGGLGVMLIMRWPQGGGAFAAGRVVEALVSQIDIYPTLCEIVGVERPGWLEGASLLPLLRGETESVREEVFAEINYHVSYQPERCVRTQRYKYIRRYYDRLLPTQPNVDDGPSKALWQAHGWGERALAREALYDLMFDPHEAHNVAADSRYRGELQDLRFRLDRWMRRTDDPLLQGPIARPSGGRLIEAHQTSSSGPWADLP